MKSEIPVREMVKDATSSIRGTMKHSQIKEFIKNKYGDIDEGTINCQILAACVNLASRMNWEPHKKARLSNDSRYDFLFSVGKAEVTLYDPEIHGTWEIRMVDGQPKVAQYIIV